MKKNIYIFLACLLLCLSNNAIEAQEATFNVKGTVTSKGESLPGVNIYIKNKPGAGVVTNIDGQYQMKAQISDVLVFSFIGYKTKEKLIVKKISTLDIDLEEETGKIDEVEIVAYGKQRKVSVVGAISSINVDDLKSARSHPCRMLLQVEWPVSLECSKAVNPALMYRNSGFAVSVPSVRKQPPYS